MFEKIYFIPIFPHMINKNRLESSSPEFRRKKKQVWEDL